jgi:hypothetical protein
MDEEHINSADMSDLTMNNVSLEGDPNSDGERDELGEKKVDLDGYLADGREYAVPVFSIGTKHPRRLSMLAKEPSALLGFRDSYVFFMRNPDLKRVDATEEDREYMDRHGLLPNTLRKRNILLVSARSVFKKFGHLVVRNGRRWKDDYFESRMEPPTAADLAAMRAARVAPQWDPSSVVPRLAPQPPRVREKDIPPEQRLYRAALLVRELNASFVQRRKALSHWREPHTGIDFVKQITQPTTCRVVQVPSSEATDQNTSSEVVFDTGLVSSTDEQDEGMKYPIALVDGQYQHIWPM